MFKFIINICSFFSHFITTAHYAMVRLGWLKIPGCIYSTLNGVYKSLHEIWIARLFRRVVSMLLMTPFRKQTLQLVNFPPPVKGGCIITSCHTPWIRLISQWCRATDFAIMIVSGAWIERAKPVCKNGKGVHELRQIINHLRAGGRVLIAGDVLVGSKTCAAIFFDEDCKVSLAPVRLARIAEVPVITAVTKLEDGRLNIREGLKFDLQAIKNNPNKTMKNILSSIEIEIRKSPSIWTTFVRKPLSKTA